MSLDKETVQKVARLARIRMSDEELDNVLPRLQKIIEFVEQLSEIDTDNVEPLANVMEISGTMRDDVVNDGNCPEKILANAPEEIQNYFVVSKVVE